MQVQTVKSLLSVVVSVAATASLMAFVQPAVAQTGTGGSASTNSSRAGASKNKEGEAPPAGLDQQTAKVLSEAIEMLNMENFAGAAQKIATLKLDKLSPYERSTTEQILFQIAYSQEKYAEARDHLQKAIDAGGLNEQQVSDAKYQSAQLFIQEEKWKEGAAALEEWLKTATKPNSAAYYLLAAAYYQMDDFDRALPPAKKAVELAEKPSENWLSMLSALYLQKDQYKDAIPVLEQLVALAPSKKTYWSQLSSVYGQLEDYPKALAIMQLAYSAGLVTDDQEVRRLADLLMFNDVPYRCGQVLESAIEKKTVKVDDKLYEKLANCWIASGELERSIQPLTRAAEVSDTGDLFVRLGEVQMQREDWQGMQTAIQKGIDKGQLKDTANAQLLMGISLYNQKKCNDAKSWLQKARSVEKTRSMATGYLQLCEAQA
jgi:tetratricopeptide (TPR) repeat protein